MTAATTLHEDFITLTPELGIPFAEPEAILDLRERAMAACESAKFLSRFGADLDTSEEDEELAHILANAYAADPEKASKAVTDKRLAQMTPPSIIAVGTILEEFGHLVARDSQRLRNLVTNKLIIESDNPDPRIRLRAIELLGKISDVGLFTEKREVTVTHTSSTELRARLKGKLQTMLQTEPDATDAEYEVVQDDSDS